MKHFKRRLYLTDVMFNPCINCGSGVGGAARGWLYLDKKSYYAYSKNNNTIVHNSIQALQAPSDLFDQPEAFNELVAYIRICTNCRGLQYGGFDGAEILSKLIVTIKRC